MKAERGNRFSLTDGTTSKPEVEDADIQTVVEGKCVLEHLINGEYLPDAPKKRGKVSFLGKAGMCVLCSFFLHQLLFPNTILFSP